VTADVRRRLIRKVFPFLDETFWVERKNENVLLCFVDLQGEF